MEKVYTGARQKRIRGRARFRRGRRTAIASARRPAGRDVVFRQSLPVRQAVVSNLRNALVGICARYSSGRPVPSHPLLRGVGITVSRLRAAESCAASVVNPRRSSATVTVGPLSPHHGAIDDDGEILLSAADLHRTGATRNPKEAIDELLVHTGDLGDSMTRASQDHWANQETGLPAVADVAPRDRGLIAALPCSPGVGSARAEVRRRLNPLDKRLFSYWKTTRESRWRLGFRSCRGRGLRAEVQQSLTRQSRRRQAELYASSHTSAEFSTETVPAPSLSSAEFIMTTSHRVRPL